MKPTWEKDGVELYLGDCREILPHVRADAVVTDPPYIVHAGKGGGCFGDREHLVNTGGFTDEGCDYSFLNGLRDWFCFCSRRQLRELIGIAEKSKRFNVLIWCKPNPVPTCNNKYLPDVEFIVHAYSKGRLFGDMSYKSNFIVCPCGMKETEHPNEKPIVVVSKLVRLCTEQSETILDPYMGSGTTGVAAVQMGRKFIGIEIVQKYFEIAKRRIQAAMEQPDMLHGLNASHEALSSTVQGQADMLAEAQGAS